MKVLITGGAGYIGAVVTEHLLSIGMEVVVLDKLLYGGESLIGFFANSRFTLRQGDVRDRADVLEAMRGCSAVIHLAAIVGEPACGIDPEASWSINYAGTENVLAAVAESGIERLIYVSTCSNYGISDPNTLADETFPLQPLSKYAESKTGAENLVLANAPPTCCTVLRFGTICGLSPRMRFDLLVSEMARSAVLNEPIGIFGPTAWRPFLHARDAGRAIEHLLATPEEKIRGRVFNVVGENCQKSDLVNLVLKHYPKTAIEVTEKQPDLRDYRVSAERIKNELGFTPKYTVEDAFLETAAAVAKGVFRDPKWTGHSAVAITPSDMRVSKKE